MATERTVVKKVKNAVLYSDGTIRIDNLRLSYAHVWEPQEERNDAGEPTGKKSYSVVGIASKTTHTEAKNLCVEVINKMMADNKVKALPAEKKFIRNGDDTGKEEYENAWTISAREVKAPALRHADKSKLDRSNSKHADIIYSGCYGNVLIRPWFQNNKHGKRVNAGLSAVQFFKDGEPFGSAIRDEDVDDTFDEHEVEGGADPDDVDDL